MSPKAKPLQPEQPNELEDFARELGERIEAVRSRLGVSQSELARRTGIVHPVIWKLEHGKLKRPKMEYVIRIARALEVNTEQLLPSSAASELAAIPQAAVPAAAPSGRPPLASALPFSAQGQATEHQGGLPPGLEGFLERHEEQEKVTRRERWYLSQSRFTAEPWIEFNDIFWREMLLFWRNYLRMQDSSPGGPPSSLR